jgi:hypothetical protein
MVLWYSPILWSTIDEAAKKPQFQTRQIVKLLNLRYHSLGYFQSLSLVRSNIGSKKDNRKWMGSALDRFVNGLCWDGGKCKRILLHPYPEIINDIKLLYAV